MKVIGISTSPRKNKNTEFAVNTVLEKIKSLKPEIETEIITLAGKNIQPCNACGFCRDNFSCFIKDDFNDIADKLKNEDIKAIVFGSPVYMGGICGLGKNFMDRTVMFRRNGFYFANKIGAAVAVGGSRNGGQELTLQNIHASFLIHDMIVVGDSQNSAHFGGTGYERAEGGIENDRDSMVTFHNLGKKIASLI